MVGGKENVSKTTTAGCWRGRAPSPTADGAGVSLAVRWLLLLSKSRIASQPSASARSSRVSQIRSANSQSALVCLRLPTARMRRSARRGSSEFDLNRLSALRIPYAAAARMRRSARRGSSEFDLVGCLRSPLIMTLNRHTVPTA